MNGSEAILARLLAPMRARLQMMLARAVVAAIDDARALQSLQIELLADEVADGAEHFQPYGLAAHPHAGAEAVVAFAGGLRSHPLVLSVADRRYRLKSLTAGEVAIYDDQGQVVWLKRDGIYVESGTKIVISAPQVEVTAETVTVDADTASIVADTVNLGGSGGTAVARVGDDVNMQTGKIVSGSAKVTAA
jgi:phage baseplate assembly protein V